MAVRRYALLDGEDVVNVILFDNVADDYEPDEGLHLKLATANVGVGWKYVNKAWVPAPEQPIFEDPIE